jgi:multidrug efflux system membrane fusion protein
MMMRRIPTFRRSRAAGSPLLEAIPRAAATRRRHRDPAAAWAPEVLTAGLLAAALAGAGCSNGDSSFQQPPVPIVSAEAVSKNLPYEIVSIGTVEAYSTVSVNSQVGGVLSRVYFKEGDDVRRGDRLFLIDPAPFEAALKAARAKLARDRATLDYTEENVKRYDELAKKDYITAQEYSNLLTDLEAIRATVRADEADVESAKLDLDHCTIESPIDGRIGTLLIDQGNVVKANADNPIIVIHQISPIYVRFTLAQQYLPDILKHSAAESLEVRAFSPGESPGARHGHLTFVDNAVDASTGTILLKAEFPNEDLTLWPGEFVNAVLVLRELEGAVVVPAQAIGTGQMGDFVFVVKADATVELRPVTVSYRLDDDAVIERGVEAGERVVIDGQMRLRPGSAVVERPPVSGDKANAS